MKKTLAHEARDQGLHAVVGAGITLGFAFIGIGLVYLVPICLGIGLVREWVQHKAIYLPRGGSLVDIIFFGVGSLLMCLTLGGMIWILKML